RTQSRHRACAARQAFYQEHSVTNHPRRAPAVTFLRPSRAETLTQIGDGDHTALCEMTQSRSYAGIGCPERSNAELGTPLFLYHLRGGYQSSSRTVPVATRLPYPNVAHTGGKHMATSTVTATAAAPHFSFSEGPTKTHAPYGLPVLDHCSNCTLRNSNFFCSLSASAITAFDQLKHVTAYPEGALVFVEGQTANGVYLLCQGRAKLTTTNAEGKTLMVRIAEAGEIIGLNSCISGRPQEFT